MLQPHVEMKRVVLLSALLVGAIAACSYEKSTGVNFDDRARERKRPMPALATSPKASPRFLLDDLDDVAKTKQIADRDQVALRAVADWIKSFIVHPHKDLGRAGPVCPFVPEALERKTLWLIPEQIGNRTVGDLVQLVNRYKTQLLKAEPVDGDDAAYKSFVIVFSDLSPDRAKALFGDVLKQVAVPSYEQDGIVIGAFYEGNEGSALYNSAFHPFTSPAPFVLIRRGVISDWKFFLDDEQALDRWAHRYGNAAVHVLADELRRLQWRAHGAAPGAD